MGLAAGPLSRHPRMADEDHQALQLLLTFVRNLVSIPDPVAVAGSAGRTATMQVCSFTPDSLLKVHRQRWKTAAQLPILA